MIKFQRQINYQKVNYIYIHFFNDQLTDDNLFFF